MLPNSVYTVQRVFEYDYIYIDAVFLIVWLGYLFWNKKYKALIFSALISPIIYTIDAYIWWNIQAGPTFSLSTYIREYWVGGVQMPHPLGPYFWLKFGADFMMTISYSLFAFSWLWIAFENLKKNKLTDSIKYTFIWLVFWLVIPFLSFNLNIDNTLVQSVRHMNSQYFGWVINFFVGFGILFVLYRKNISLVFKLFLIGVVSAVIMELPLYVFGIRPITWGVLLFDAIFMINQGVPYLYILFDKIIPFIKTRR